MSWWRKIQIVRKWKRSLAMKRVLSVQSHVVHGYVGNKCAVFPLQLLGYEVDAINSVQFCCHTGYPRFSGTVLGGPQLDELVDGLEANELLGRGSRTTYSHLLTGYIGSSTFLRSVLRLLSKLREQGEGLWYVCDPVLGDNGKLYVPPELVEIYRSEVLPMASVATPNQFEIEILTGVKIESEADAARACEALHALGVPVVVVTTLDYARDRGVVLMMLSERSNQHLVEIPLLQASFTGSGDLTSALLLAWMHEHKDDLPLALEKTAATVYGVLEATTKNVAERVYGDLVVPPELDIIGSKTIIEHPPLLEKKNSAPRFPAVRANFNHDVVLVAFRLRGAKSSEGLSELLGWLDARNVPSTFVDDAPDDHSSPDVAAFANALAALPASGGRLLYVTDDEEAASRAGDDPRCVPVVVVRGTTALQTVPSLSAIRRFFPRALQ